ncbi:MAG: beta-glucuronidase [bacterium]
MLYPQENNYRKFKDLSGIWKFCKDTDNIGKKTGWFSKQPKDVRPIAVPASWNEQYEDLKNYMGTGWYFNRAFIPEDWHGKTVRIRFGCANYMANVWINGKFCGSHEGGHLPFEFNITGKIEFGKTNLIAVSVNMTLGKDTSPAGFSLDPGESNVIFEESFPQILTDYFPYGGLQRRVWLLCTTRKYIEDITIITKINNKKAIVSYRVKITGNFNGNAIVSLGMGKNRLLQESNSINGIIKGNLQVSNPKLWSCKNPNLYNFSIKSTDNNQIDKYTLPVGIRTISIKGNKILLNNQPIFLNGFGKHEDNEITGRNVPDAVMIKDFALLKWIGANSIRTTHYPHAEEILYMADKQGILIIDEIQATNLTPVSFKNPGVLKKCQRMLEELINRDKNHPSVIMWCVANEPDTRSKSAGPFLKKLLDSAKLLDHTRPATYASCITTGFNEFAGKDVCRDQLDIICLNRYFGWYSQPGQLDRAMECLSTDLDRIYKKHRKPIMLTEFGADAINGMHSEPPELFTEEYQAEFIRKYHEVIKSKPYIVGGHVWTFSDFKTSQIFCRVMNNRKGVFTRTREPKMSARILKEIWRKP